MHPISRIAFAVVAVGMLTKLVRSFQTGRMMSEDAEYSLDDEPITFSLVASFDAVAVLFCGWLAAGGDAETFYRWALPSVAALFDKHS